jgi:hypothetical protein
LTADDADIADEGRNTSDHPRHLRNLRLNVLEVRFVASLGRAVEPFCGQSALKNRVAECG